MSIVKSAARLLIILAVIVFALVGSPRKVTGFEKEVGAAARLVKVQEVRRAMLVSKETNTYEFTKPGLELTFEVTLPDGKQILDIDQPAKIVATDSTGHDLTDIEKSFTGKRQHVTFMRTMGAPSKEFTIQLAPPARQATHINVATTLDVWGYNELKESVVTVTAKPVELDAALFGGTKVTAVLRSRGDRTRLVLTPGTIKQFVEDVTLRTGGDDVSNRGAMWNNAMLSYDFDAKATESMTVALIVRSDMSKMHCTIDLKNQLLP